MNVIDTELPGVKIVEPRVFGDSRGFFLETYNAQRYQEAGINMPFVQDNHSKSSKGVLRGMHYQVTKPQDKLVWCIDGAIWDVAVDTRPGSETFGRWVGVELNTENKRQLLVPKGFAHGFCVLSDEAEVIYKCSTFYAPEDEAGFIWNDPKVGIAWPVENPKLSSRDTALPLLEATKLPAPL